MASEAFIRRSRDWYRKLIRFYPKPYRERFGEPMEQTFTDLCRERVSRQEGLFRFALWMFIETSAAILRENCNRLQRCAMNRGSTLFLRLVLSLVAIGALTVCVLPLPRIVSQEAAKTPQTAYQIYFFMLGAYVMAALFFFALYQAFKLLAYIDRNATFSHSSVQALRHIKRSANIISLLTVMGIVTVMVLSAGKGEDTAGVIMVGLVMTFASIVASAVADVLQKQVQRGIEAGRGSSE